MRSLGKGKYPFVSKDLCKKHVTSNSVALATGRRQGCSAGMADTHPTKHRVHPVLTCQVSIGLVEELKAPFSSPHNLQIVIAEELGAARRQSLELAVHKPQLHLQPSLVYRVYGKAILR